MIGLAASAQDNVNDQPQMADAMRRDGKIYVVVAVLLVVLLGMFVYMFRIDRKLTRLEKSN
ncbi:MAG: CcmD family protein [Gemmatimonadaceae bacterium]|nr:CcmD family protein [Chitinophagaceae bacterium]